MQCVPVHRRDGMVSVVVVSGVEDRIVGSQHSGFIAPMQVNPIPVEECSEYGKQKVHVDGHKQREYNHRQCTHKLVHVLVCNHCEWRWVEELVVMLVDIPKNWVSMTDPMICIFVKICEEEYDNRLDNKRLGVDFFVCIWNSAISMRISPSIVLSINIIIYLLKEKIIFSYVYFDIIRVNAGHNVATNNPLHIWIISLLTVRGSGNSALFFF